MLQQNEELFHLKFLIYQQNGMITVYEDSPVPFFSTSSSFLEILEKLEAAVLDYCENLNWNDNTFFFHIGEKEIEVIVKHT